MNRLAKSIGWIMLTLLVVLGPTLMVLNSGDKRATDALQTLPVQDAGRLKPLDTFTRETLQLVYGSQSYKTKNGDKRPAIEIVLTWMLLPQYWDVQKIVEISHRGLKDSLKLDPAVKHFTPNELFSNDRLGLVMQELAAFRETKQKLDPYFQAAQRLESQIGMYQALKTGKALRIVPPQGEVGHETGIEARWLSVDELSGDLQQKFSTVMRSFIQSLPANEASESAPPAKDPTVPALDVAVADFVSAARAENPGVYPSAKDMDIEVFYGALHPFGITWVLYLVAAIFLGIAWQTGKVSFYGLGWSVAVGAFLMHTVGFGLRMYLTGRPPVSNMYESVIWVSWGALVFAFVFEWLYRRRFILLAGAIVGILCLIVADLAPNILDPSLQPLEPVLRSNMWLTVHVLTITLSYSAFFLAWGLGLIGLFFILLGEKPTGDKPRVITMSLYRAIQVGVVLLAAGTILGGVWADYSWGRFWGWDPKETWALIALLGYLAMLHGRLIGMLQNFGMMVGAVVSFNLVIMAWYGVNYVLGAGLHSYGFGAGGVQYMAAFVILNLIYVGYVAFVRYSRQNSASSASADVSVE